MAGAGWSGTIRYVVHDKEGPKELWMCGTCSRFERNPLSNYLCGIFKAIVSDGVCIDVRLP